MYAILSNARLRFSLYVESAGLAGSAINRRLAVLCRLVYEAANSGLPSFG